MFDVLHKNWLYPDTHTLGTARLDHDEDVCPFLRKTMEPFSRNSDVAPWNLLIFKVFPSVRSTTRNWAVRFRYKSVYSFNISLVRCTTTMSEKARTVFP